MIFIQKRPNVYSLLFPEGLPLVLLTGSRSDDWLINYLAK